MVERRFSKTEDNFATAKDQNLLNNFLRYDTKSFESGPSANQKAGSAPGICPCNATYDKFMVSINNSITVSAVLVTKGELASETVNFDTKTMYQF